MDRKTAIGLCLCQRCPTFIDCKEDIAFCMAVPSKSRCIRKEAGCLCPACPVLEKEGFQHVYYCIRGNETEQK